MLANCQKEGLLKKKSKTKALFWVVYFRAQGRHVMHPQEAISNNPIQHSPPVPSTTTILPLAPLSFKFFSSIS